MGSPRDAIAAARDTLVRSGIAAAEARVDAEVLARHVLGWDRAQLLTNGRDPAPSNFQDAFDVLVRRRGAREPVAQILGRREFWGLDFEVTRDVLVPRPETELLIEEAIDFARGHPCGLVIDVGTGSGCIAVAVAHALPGTSVIAIDGSRAALDVARRNATSHQVADRIAFRHGDLLDEVSETADLILSNPPYVPDADAATMQADVLHFEPHAALFGGADGLDLMRRLVWDARSRIAAGGRLIVEFGFGQEPGVRALAAESGWEILRLREDLQGIPRAAVLTRAAIA